MSLEQQAEADLQVGLRAPSGSQKELVAHTLCQARTGRRGDLPCSARPRGLNVQATIRSPSRTT